MKMAISAFAGICLCGVVLAAGTPQAVTISPGNSEIVLAKGSAASVSFAAEEMNAVLAEALGSPLPVVSVPTAGRTSIFLGESEWTRAAGLSTNRLARDAFVVKAEADRLYIVGRDDARTDLGSEGVERGRALMVEHATLFGVYEVLERYAGVRFYFPGEIGTVVPKTKAIRVPVGESTVAPAFQVRDVLIFADGPAPDAKTPQEGRRWKALDWLRLRLQTESIPCMHGQSYLSFCERFHKTHPEYFALVRDGGGKLHRDAVPHRTGMHDGQLCQSSAAWDEIYADCKAYLTGASAESRGVRTPSGKGFGWNRNFKGRYLDVMPIDGMKECFCDACQKSYDKSKRYYASDLVWRRTAELANRLSKDGFDAIVTQMAYDAYRGVPTCALPSNVWVMVAETGPWGVAHQPEFDQQYDEVRSWTEKLGHRIWMWTYPSKFGPKEVPGVPDLAPRAFDRYFKRMAPHIIGAFLECEGEKSIFHYLNYYVFSKLAWNPGLDVERLLEEHFRMMFGAAAPEMAAFYADLERKWTKEVFDRWCTDKNGKITPVVANEVSVWRTIYSPEVRAGWKALFDRAASKLADDPASAKRLAFIRREFLDRICEVGEANETRWEPEKARARYRAMDPVKNLFPMMTEPRHLVVTNAKAAASLSFPLAGRLKPDTKYRVSAVFKLKDVHPDLSWGRFGGALFSGTTDHYVFFPRNEGSLYSGSFDWTYRSYEFVTGEKFEGRNESSLGFTVCRGTGEAWVDCLTLEEVVTTLEDPVPISATLGDKPLKLTPAYVADMPFSFVRHGRTKPLDPKTVVYVARFPVGRGTTLTLDLHQPVPSASWVYPVGKSVPQGSHNRFVWYHIHKPDTFVAELGENGPILYVFAE